MAIGAVQVGGDEGAGWKADEEGGGLLISYGCDDREMRIAVLGGYLVVCIILCSMWRVLCMFLAMWLRCLLVLVPRFKRL